MAQMMKCRGSTIELCMHYKRSDKDQLYVTPPKLVECHCEAFQQLVGLPPKKEN